MFFSYIGTFAFVLIAFFIGDNITIHSSVLGITIQDRCCKPLLLSPMASSGDNLYVVWPDNKTGNWELFFTKSENGGYTFDAPLNISNNTSFSANATIISHDNHVSITWWDNKTGKVEPFIRSSHDYGETFNDPLMLNISSIG
jgi:hypothetical protein